MKKLMRLLAAVLALTMLCEMLPLAAFAQSDIGQAVTAAAQGIEEENSLSGSCGENATWEVDYSTGRLTISGTGAMEDYSFYDKAPWYEHMYYINRVVIQKGITSIGKNAFWDCEYLTGVTIPEGVESIGDNAFSICKRLRRITIPDGVTHIGRDAFWNCVRLVDITLPESATSIGEGAFEDCDAIENIALPSGMTSIAADTFSSCGSLKNIVIPDGVTSIGNSAFSYCGLTDIMIPENVEYIGEWAFRGCEKLESIVIPDGITSIGDYTFCECSSLTDITLPESVESIGKHAFEKSAITNITLSDNVTSIGESAFEKSKLTNIEIPDGVTRIENKTFYACDTLTDVMFSADVTFIGSGAFAQCKRLTDVYYGGSEEKWKEIDISFSNDPLINATIHYQDEEEPSKEFTFGRDNFRFAHSTTSFFADELDADNQATKSAVDLLTDEPDYNHYNISKGKFDQLTAGLSASQKEKIRQKAYARWGGSCYGLSLVAMMHYASPVRVPLDGFDFYDEEAPKNIYNLDFPYGSTSNTDLINYYYLTQNLPSVSRAKYLRAFACALSTKASITNIINALQENIPVIVSLKTHAVVLLTILSETDTYYLLRVYDPNMLSNGENQTPSTMKLYKNSIGTIKVDYPANNPHYKTVPYYYLATETYLYDPVNYFGVSTTVYSETADDVEVSTITAPAGSSFVVTMGKSSFTVTEGEITACTDDLKNALVADNSVNDTTDGTSDATVEFLFPQYTGELKISFTSDAAGSMDILWNNSFVSVLTDGVTSLTYDESARTVDVKADDPTAVSLLMTQNTVNDSWPWHSWAVDTTGTTTLHAELDSEGLHLTGDGLTDAKYATENADTEQTSEGIINVQPDETGKTSVTIINKNDGDTDDTEVKGEDKAEETTYTVTVSGGTASPAKAKEGETVTITAEKTDTFQNWTVVAGGITLENENLPTTTFTMGKENVVITANYSSGGNITPPSPGEPGQSPSDDGGAGIVLAIGAAATVAAGIGAIALMPVKVEGKVELADHTALPGAKIALLQNGKVVAQTTTDANGKFALKVKRGSYELTAAYTDANGQLMHKTTSFKAPAKNLTVTF